MQTFLPYANYAASASVLDTKRLGWQRSETLQIMTALMTGTGWVSHPATLMWRRYEQSLLDYQFAICHEWVSRGYKDTRFAKTKDIYRKNLRWTEELGRPYWFGSERFHMSHQSNLLRKDPQHYTQFFPGIPIDMDYVYPEPMADYKKFNISPWWTPPDPPLF